MLDLARKSEILSEIAETLASETEFSSNGLLLVAAVDRGFLSLSLFSDRGRDVEYRHVDYDRYATLLNDLWAMEPLSKRWEEVEIYLIAGQFKVQFVYQEDFDPDELDTERRHATASDYFGGKPIKYPGLDGRDGWVM
jgi:hypothetical protein